jgi:thiol:disulfide interchange protein DsbC
VGKQNWFIPRLAAGAPGRAFHPAGQGAAQRASGLILVVGLLLAAGGAMAQDTAPDTPDAAPAAPLGQPLVAPGVIPDASATLPPLQPCPPGANSPASIPVPPMPLGLAAAIRDRVHRRIGGDVTSVCRTPFGLFEVVIDADVLYVDERVNYLVAGNAFDLRTKENLTAHRKEDAVRVDFKALPLQLAVKTVRGKGTRVLAVFEDPNCPYCKRFEKDIASLTDTTIYTFLYPILSRDASAADDSYPKSRAIWCAPDRTAAWSGLMLEGKRLPAAADGCKHPLEEILALGQKLHITGTPTLLFTDGRRAPGAIPLEQVEKMMADANGALAP